MSAEPTFINHLSLQIHINCQLILTLSTNFLRFARSSPNFSSGLQNFMQKVKGLVARYPELISLSTPSFIPRNYLAMVTVGYQVVTQANSRGTLTNFCRISLGRLDKCTNSAFSSEYLYTFYSSNFTQPTSQHFQSCTPLDMIHKRSQLADMHQASVKGWRSTSHKHGQALNFTIGQTLAKALFGCGVVVGFLILIHIITQLQEEHENGLMSSISPVRQEKGRCRSHG